MHCLDLFQKPFFLYHRFLHKHRPQRKKTITKYSKITTILPSKKKWSNQTTIHQNVPKLQRSKSWSGSRSNYHSRKGFFELQVLFEFFLVSTQLFLSLFSLVKCILCPKDSLCMKLKAMKQLESIKRPITLLVFIQEFFFLFCKTQCTVRCSAWSISTQIFCLFLGKFCSVLRGLFDSFLMLFIISTYSLTFFLYFSFLLQILNHCEKAVKSGMLLHCTAGLF